MNNVKSDPRRSEGDTEERHWCKITYKPFMPEGLLTGQPDTEAKSHRKVIINNKLTCKLHVMYEHARHSRSILHNNYSSNDAA